MEFKNLKRVFRHLRGAFPEGGFVKGIQHITFMPSPNGALIVVIPTPGMEEQCDQYLHGQVEKGVIERVTESEALNFLITLLVAQPSLAPDL